MSGRKRKISSIEIEMDRVLNVSHPFARAIVQGRKKYELRSYEPYKSLDWKRFFIAETMTPAKISGVHDDLKRYRPRPGYVLGSITLEGSFPLDSSHMNVKFASECGLTLDGLKQFKKQCKKL